MRAGAISGDGVVAALVGQFQMAAPYAIHRGAVSLVEGTQPTLRERFYRLNVPCAYVYGQRSVPANPESASPDAPYPDYLTREGIRVFVVPNAGHNMVWDNPNGFANAVKEFLTD